MVATSVFDVVRTAALLRPDAPALLGSRGEITYGQLIGDIERVSRFVLDRGLREGRRVGILMGPSYLHVLLILAFDRLGITSVSMPGVPDHVTRPEIEALKLDAVFAFENRPEGVGMDWIALDPEAGPQALEIPSRAAESEVPIDRDPGRITRLVLSSGTTGTPRAVALRRDIALRRIVVHHLYCEGMGSNRYLLGMPLMTIAGYGWLLMALCRGAAVIPCLAPPMIARMTDTYRASHMLLTPRQFRDVVEIGERRHGYFESVRFTVTGGAPFDVRLLHRSRAVLGPGIWNGYTSTEAGSVARGHVGLIAEDPSLIGPVLPFVTLEIVDDEDRPLPTGEVGIVRIASDCCATGYEGEATFPGVFRHGFVYPGDRGALDGQGRFHLHGRADEMVNFDGGLQSPEPVERLIVELPGVRDAAVFQGDFGRGIEVCAAVVLADGETLDGVSRRIRESLGAMAPSRLLGMTDLPRNAMGKVLRREIAAKAGDGKGAERGG